MKVMLLQGVKSLGKTGTLVGVSEGCARNFLLPRKLGTATTAENLNTLKLKQANEAEITAEQLTKVEALAAKVEADSVTVHIKDDKNDKTYGSVLIREFAEAVKEQPGLELDKKKIALARLVKNFDSYGTVVKLHRDMRMTFKVSVTEAK